MRPALFSFCLSSKDEELIRCGRETITGPLRSVWEPSPRARVLPMETRAKTTAIENEDDVAMKPKTSIKQALIVEANWDGDLQGQWILEGDDTLSAGPKAQCDLLVSKTILSRRRNIIAVDENTQSYTVDGPPGTLFSWPHSAHRDAYPLPALRHATTTSQRYAIAQALDLHLGPWHLRLRPTPRVPTVAHRRRATKKPIAALIASALIHALVITAALAAPPPKASLATVIPAPVRPNESPCWLWRHRSDIAVTSATKPPPLPKNAPAWLRELARMPPVYASIDLVLVPRKSTGHRFSPLSLMECYRTFPHNISELDPSFVACLIEADKINDIHHTPSWLRIVLDPQLSADMDDISNWLPRPPEARPVSCCASF